MTNPIRSDGTRQEVEVIRVLAEALSRDHQQSNNHGNCWWSSDHRLFAEQLVAYLNANPTAKATLARWAGEGLRCADCDAVLDLRRKFAATPAKAIEERKRNRAALYDHGRGPLIAGTDVADVASFDEFAHEHPARPANETTGEPPRSDWSLGPLVLRTAYDTLYDLTGRTGDFPTFPQFCAALAAQSIRLREALDVFGAAGDGDR